MRSPASIWIAVAALSGCGAFSTTPFSGSIVEMSLSGAAETAPGEHLELWARTPNDDVVRVDNGGSGALPYGLMIRKAITFNDPCMIDSAGHQLRSADAYQTFTSAGVTQTAQQQADQITNRIAQVVATTVCSSDGSACGHQSDTLLAVLAYTTAQLPPFDPSMSPAARLQACQAYWSDPLAYTPNPAQLTAPLHGTLLGFIYYSTQDPPANFDGVTIRSPIRLSGVRELWVTRESVAVDRVSPVSGGTLLLDGAADRGGAGTLHFTLSSPLPGGPSGVATVLTDLDHDDAY
jgi:hypothetical protein